ncbi:MAG: hypothetical protein PHC64_08015 [Candidatus Gastranaerophilales bacterium]|nr:hypothetical protein [Candidatus Gastranaerophilales bacterium]
MKIFQLLENIQQDIIELKAICDYEEHGLNQEQSMNQLKGVTKNLEDHLEDLVNDILRLMHKSIFLQKCP